MGTDMKLLYKGEEVAFLGRAYNYNDIAGELPSEEEADNDFNELYSFILKEIYKVTGYSEEQDIESDGELSSLTSDLANAGIKFGRRCILNRILENQDFKTERCWLWQLNLKSNLRQIFKLLI